jgi:hypothetical protein
MREELAVAEVGQRVQRHHGDGAGLDPAVSAAALPGVNADRRPGQRTQPPQQRRLVRLHRQQVVRTAGVQVLGMAALRVQRIGSDHRIGDVEPVEHDRHGGDLAGLLFDRGLGQHRPGVLVERGHQMWLPPLIVARSRPGASHGLAVDRDHRPPLPDRHVWRWALAGGELSDVPSGDRLLQPGWVDVDQDPPDRRRVGDFALDTQGVEHQASLIAGVLPDRGERTGPGHHRARRQHQQRHQRVPDPARLTRIRDPLKRLHQRRRHIRGTGTVARIHRR